jgi:hypothetical protein
MKTKITLEKGDVRDLLGRLIIQINDSLENSHQINWDKFEFLLEKRISRVSITSTQEANKYFFQGHFYAHSRSLSEDEFMDKFNKRDEGRYYRLLTLEETLEFGRREFEYSEEKLKRCRKIVQE